MISFTKLHGNGNDFILVDEYENEVIPEEEKSGFAAKYCDRRCGIGADGILYPGRSDKADIKMRIFNPDGTEAEMCGNGIRCLAKYAFDKGYIRE
ncbi:MAG TPA: diaminopimelate epimerase, partial [Candidatus Methanoperedens sp.]